MGKGTRSRGGEGEEEGGLPSPLVARADCTTYRDPFHACRLGPGSCHVGWHAAPDLLCGLPFHGCGTKIVHRGTSGRAIQSQLRRQCQ